METDDKGISPTCHNFVNYFYVEMSTSYQTKTWTFGKKSIGEYVVKCKICNCQLYSVDFNKNLLPQSTWYSVLLRVWTNIQAFQSNRLNGWCCYIIFFESKIFLSFSFKIFLQGLCDSVTGMPVLTGDCLVLKWFRQISRISVTSGLMRVAVWWRCTELICIADINDDAVLLSVVWRWYLRVRTVPNQIQDLRWGVLVE